MKNYLGRQQDLKEKLNSHLYKLTGYNKDYYSTLSQSDIAGLKTVLSDINNVFTLKLTLTAVNWICENFNLDISTRAQIIERIDSIKPNSPGYDIQIEEPSLKLIAEVKCVFPANEGEKYQAAQWNSILDDAYKLVNGKRQLADTSDFYKFLFVINIGLRTEKAVDNLLKPSKGTSDKPLRKNRHAIKNQIDLFKENSINEIGKNKVYLKLLEF